MKPLALILLASAPALASRFPTASEPWHYEGRAPVSGGEARFARLDAVPDRRGGWTVAVTCGRVRVRDGRETVTYRGAGSGGRSRGGWLGGTMTASGFPTLGWTITQRRDGILDQRIAFGAPGEDKVARTVSATSTQETEMAKKNWAYLVLNLRERYFPKEATEALAKRIDALGELFREHEHFSDVHELRRVEKAVALIEAHMKHAEARSIHADAGLNYQYMMHEEKDYDS